MLNPQIPPPLIKAFHRILQNQKSQLSGTKSNILLFILSIYAWSEKFNERKCSCNEKYGDYWFESEHSRLRKQYWWWTPSASQIGYFPFFFLFPWGIIISHAIFIFFVRKQLLVCETYQNSIGAYLSKILRVLCRGTICHCPRCPSCWQHEWHRIAPSIEWRQWGRRQISRTPRTVWYSRWKKSF